MQFQVTYNRPSTKNKRKRVREVSGWRETTQELLDNFLYAYELHGFHSFETKKGQFLLSHPQDGTRFVETR